MDLLNVVAGVNLRGQQVFLARRNPGKSLEGLWEFPGGKVERGESKEIALAREFKEEFGINIRVLRYLGESTSNIHLTAYIIESEENPRFHNSHSEYGWFSKAEIANLEVCPADEAIMKLVFDEMLGKQSAY